jgi:hypothetical protein
MKELIIHHLPAQQGAPAQVRLGYRRQPGAQAQERTAPFPFTPTDEQRGLNRYAVFAGEGEGTRAKGLPVPSPERWGGPKRGPPARQASAAPLGSPAAAGSLPCGSAQDSARSCRREQ